MVKNRIILVLCLVFFSLCMVYAQTSGRWINCFEDEIGIYSYRSDLKTDKDNNHYVWIKINITSPKVRMEIANDLNSSTPIHHVLFQFEFDSNYELVKLLQFAALSNSGKVLAEAKSETLSKWNVVNEDDKFVCALSKQLRGRFGRVYEEQNRRSGRVYPETNNQSGKVYEDLFGIIKEKQRKQNEAPPKQTQIEEDDIIDTDIENSNSPVETVKKETPTKEEEAKVFDVVDEMPSFPGGDAELMRFLHDHMKYPAVAEENGIQGKVIVNFIVERDGSISNAQIKKSVDSSLDKEAIRLIKSMPRWIPGKQNGSTVRVRYTVPVNFRLQ